MEKAGCETIKFLISLVSRGQTQPEISPLKVLILISSKLTHLTVVRRHA